MSAPCRSHPRVVGFAWLLAISVAIPRAGAAPLFQSQYDLYFGPAGQINPAGSAVGDVNGDGRNDLVSVANDGFGGPAYLWVQLGASGGVLDPVPVISPGPSSYNYWHQLASIDLDAHLDFVTSGAQGVSVSLGNGDGTFQAAVLWPSPAGSEVGIGDVNGDGFTDLVVPIQAPADSVEFLYGDGAGGFTAGPRYAVGTNAQLCAVVDADGDPYADVLVGDDPGSTLLRGTAGGGFVSSAVGIAGAFPAELDGDGIADAVGTTEAALNNGDGTFAAPIPHGMGDWYPFPVFAVDLNGDGYDDLVGQGGSDDFPISIALADGGGGFGPHVGYRATYLIEDLTCGDIDGDGNMDFAGVGTTAIASPQDASETRELSGQPLRSTGSDPDDVSGPPWAYVHRGTRDGALQQAPMFHLPHRPRSVALGDLDGNQLPDIVTGLDNGTVGVALASAPLTYPNVVQYPAAATQTSRIAIAHMNGDAYADVLALSGQVLSLWLANSNGTLGARSDFAAAGATDFEVADLDGDGDQDVALNGNPGTIRPGNGNGALGSAISLPVALTWDIDAVDLNGDLWLELVSETSGWDPLVLIADGPLSYPTSQSYPVSNTETRVLGVGRFDGDAIPDILLDGADFHLFRGLGGGAFGPGKLIDTAPGTITVPASLRVADFDGDGFDDVVKPGGGSSVISARSIGDGTFQPFERHGLGSGSVEVEAGDMNGDGRLDVVSADGRGTSGFVTILLNQAGPPVGVGPRAVPLQLAVRPTHNPVRGALQLAVDLPSREPLVVDLVDVTGRRIARREWNALGPGRHTLDFGSLTGHAPGILFARARQGNQTGMTRIALLP